MLPALVDGGGRFTGKERHGVKVHRAGVLRHRNSRLTSAQSNALTLMMDFDGFLMEVASEAGGDTSC